MTTTPRWAPASGTASYRSMGPSAVSTLIVFVCMLGQLTARMRPMREEVRGVVARSKGAPVSVEQVVVPDPGPGEAVVRVQACGVCHTDLHYREGAINDDFPFLLGHEASGIVEQVGDGVTNVAPGDFVILHWRAVCGECLSCLRCRP